MNTSAANDAIAAYLKCKLKAYLVLEGQKGIPSDYHLLLTDRRNEVDRKAIQLLQTTPDDCIHSPILTPAVLRSGHRFILNATLDTSDFTYHFDALARTDGRSRFGPYHYVPIQYFAGDKVNRDQRLLLQVSSILISRAQGKQPEKGVIIHGTGMKRTTIALTSRSDHAIRVLDNFRALRNETKPPPLMLNDHCPTCEFEERCRAQAIKDDNLSLLHGISEKEIANLRRKGIFTVTQLSYTFRARRPRKRAKRPSTPHHYALQALATREKKVYVHGRFSLPTGNPHIYLDIEGLPDRDFQYLIGLTVVDGNTTTDFSFWADDADHQSAMFSAFIDAMRCYPNGPIYHYGAYDARAIAHARFHLSRRQRKALAAVESRLVNVLPFIHSHVYFPTYSNRLKEIGKYLGIDWTDANASGIQSMVWRMLWETCSDAQLKERLVRYNLEDVRALRALVGFIVSHASDTVAPTDRKAANGAVVHTDELRSPKRRAGDFGKMEYAVADFERVNTCGYFDYQRDKILLRSKRRTWKVAARERQAKRRYPTPNRSVEVGCTSCPFCKSKDIRGRGKFHRYLVDLRFSGTGVKRWVTRFTSRVYRCTSCEKSFRSRRLPKGTVEYGRGLMAWR